MIAKNIKIDKLKKVLKFSAFFLKMYCSYFLFRLLTNRSHRGMSKLVLPLDLASAFSSLYGSMMRLAIEFRLIVEDLPLIVHPD